MEMQSKLESVLSEVQLLKRQNQNSDKENSLRRQQEKVSSFPSSQQKHEADQRRTLKERNEMRQREQNLLDSVLRKSLENLKQDLRKSDPGYERPTIFSNPIVQQIVKQQMRNGSRSTSKTRGVEDTEGNVTTNESQITLHSNTGRRVNN